MASEVGSMLVKLGLDSNQFERGMLKSRKQMTDFGGQVGGATGKITKFANALGPAGIGIAAGIAVNEVWQFTQAARQAGIESEAARNKLVQTVGSLDKYNDAINKAKIATQGMVSETQLANSVFLTLEMGLAGNAEEAAKLAFTGNILADAFKAQGASVELFNRLLASGNQILLDNFGISTEQVNVKKAEIQATKGLSDQEARLQAIKEIAITKAERLAGTMTDQQRSAREAAASYDNMVSALGELILEVGDTNTAFATFYDSVTSAATGIKAYIDVLQGVGGVAGDASDGIDWFTNAQEGLVRSLTFGTMGVKDFENQLYSLGYTIGDWQ